ncbi:hypothetical protein [Candidatus Hodgkinia cicadicola]|uniref:hypothetical protein n=1 Tax=Candidatus Hodgkinia cicadicola TaxID=573658 RepID=UPI001788CD98
MVSFWDRSVDRMGLEVGLLRIWSNVGISAVEWNLVMGLDGNLFEGWKDVGVIG